MRQVVKFALVALISSTFLTAPVVTPPASAQNLFEKLFPKAAKRQRERRQLRRERRKQREIARQRHNGQRKSLSASLRQRKVRSASVNPEERVQGAKYYTYKATPLQKLKFARVATALVKKRDKRDAKLAALEAKRLPDYRDAIIRNYAVEPDLSALAPSSTMSLLDHLDELKNVSIITERSIFKTIAAHYKKNPDLMWVDSKGHPNAKAKALLSYMMDAEAEGLNPADYAIELEENATLAEYSETDRHSKALSFEMNLAARALRYVRDAKHGRIDPNKISGYHDFPKNKSNNSSYFSKLVKSENPAGYLQASHPRDHAYGKLKSELTSLLSVETDTSVEPIASNTFLKPGGSHAELPKIIAAMRKKGSAELLAAHDETLAAYTGSESYNKGLVRFVAQFQKEKGLGPDGIVGKNTLLKLQGVSPKSKILRLKYAMERLRWHPSHLGKTHVFINQPAYRVSYMSNGKSKLSMRAVVGKPSNQTNFFADQIDHVILNPYWNVPRSILVNEFLPKLRRNPSWLDQRGYELHQGGSKVYTSASVDWWDPQSTKKYLVRQKPGAANALGELKIMFPNRHAIYMHDTPAKALFNRNKRAYSHGCVRLHDPRAMAAMVLGTKKQDVSAMLAATPTERMIKVKNKVPVYVAYFTAWPNQTSGKVEYFGDIYKRDGALTKAFKAVNNVRAVGRIKFASNDG